MARIAKYRPAHNAYKAMLKANVPMRDKLLTGTGVSAKELSHTRHRFYTENSAALTEARAEQAALKKKRLVTCHCGKPKAFKFRECYTCNQARKK